MIKKIMVMMVLLGGICLPMRSLATGQEPILGIGEEYGGLIKGEAFSDSWGTYVVTSAEEATAKCIGIKIKKIKDVKYFLPVGKAVFENDKVIYETSDNEWVVSGKDGREYKVKQIEGIALFDLVNDFLFIPEGVETIGMGVFQGCKASKISIPRSLVEINLQEHLINLKEIEVAEENENFIIEEGALLSKDGKQLFMYPSQREGTSYTTPESVEVISEYALVNNGFLESVHLTKVKRLSDFTFLNMPNLKTINISNALESTGTRAIIYNCDNLVNIFVEDGNANYYDDNGVFYYYDGENVRMLFRYPAAHALESYRIPYGVNTIINGACYHISKTKEFFIPDTVRKVYSLSFEENKIPTDYVFQFTSPRMLNFINVGALFYNLMEGSRMVIPSEGMDDLFIEAMIAKYIPDVGDVIDKDIPFIIDYERAASRINNWYVKAGKIYYFDEEGQMVKGLKSITERIYDSSINGYYKVTNTYGFHESGERFTKGFFKVEDKTYYFSQNGIRQEHIGLKEIEDKRYYFEPDYTLFYGSSKKIENRTYYFDIKTGEVICDEFSHDYVKWQINQPADCNKEGTRERTCNKCRFKEYQTIAPVSHEFGAWKIELQPSYEADGLESRQCVNCAYGETNKMNRLPKMAIEACSISKPKDAVFTGKEIKRKPVITYNGQCLIEEKDYVLHYKGNKSPGKATIIITGRNRFQGSKKAIFFIKPKAPRVIIKANNPKSCTLEFKAVGVSGYQIAWAADKKFKKKRINHKKKKITINKKNPRRTYYVKVRAYKKADGRTIYGQYAKIRRIRIRLG